MNDKNTGGQAFPHYPSANYDPGMTLRDYFAAKAMQAYCSSDEYRKDMDLYLTANNAYLMADAMIKAREA